MSESSDRLEPTGSEPTEAKSEETVPEDSGAVAAAETSPVPTEEKKAAPKRRRPVHAALFRAFRARSAVEGHVERVIKGGYEVRLSKARGFCPHSQMNLDRVEDPEQHVGKTYMFHITQVRRGGEDFVVSRRAALEWERREEAKAVRATLLEGAVMQGHVAGLARFGAFVELGAGVIGLVHVSELSHSRTTRVEDAVSVGDSVLVKILKLDDATGRISLSIRQATEDPWAKLVDRLKVGKTYPGTVKRLADFGVFVEIEPGVEGLAPASELPPCKTGWRERLEPGSTHDWLVLSVDPAQRRISLTPTVEGFEFSDKPLEVGVLVPGKVQRVEKFGVFVWLGPGRVGMMPTAMTGVPRGSDMARRFPIESDVEVMISEFIEDGRRIRLTAKGVTVAPEAAAFGTRPRDRGKKKKSPSEASKADIDAAMKDAGSFGMSLGDKLRAALGEPRG